MCYKLRALTGNIFSSVLFFSCEPTGLGLVDTPSPRPMLARRRPVLQARPQILASSRALLPQDLTAGGVSR